MLTLPAKQMVFSGFVADLIIILQSQGYGVTLGEAWRSPETCALYAADGRGVRASNHQNRLAIDLMLWAGGILQTTKAQYSEAGRYWKEFSTDELKCVWGGDFERLDVFHFAIEHNGVQ